MSAKHKSPKAIALAFAGFVYAAFTLLIAGALTGAGHGWVSGTGCAPGLLLIPAFGVAFPYRQKKFGKIILILITFGAVVTDINILRLTLKEGADYFNNAMRSLGPIVLLWLGLWAAWQLLLLKKLIEVFRGSEQPN